MEAGARRGGTVREGVDPRGTDVSYLKIIVAIPCLPFTAFIKDMYEAMTKCAVVGAARGCRPGWSVAKIVDFGAWSGVWN